mgnify:CR=1 FL=1
MIRIIPYSAVQLFAYETYKVIKKKKYSPNFFMKWKEILAFYDTAYIFGIIVILMFDFLETI